MDGNRSIPHPSHEGITICVLSHYWACGSGSWDNVLAVIVVVEPAPPCGVDCSWERLRGRLEGNQGMCYCDHITINNQQQIGQSNININHHVTTSPRHLSPQPQLTPQGGTGSTMTMARSLPQLPLPASTAGPIMMKRAQDTDRDAPRVLVFFTHWQLLLDREGEEIFFLLLYCHPFTVATVPVLNIIWIPWIYDF